MRGLDRTGLDWLAPNGAADWRQGFAQLPVDASQQCPFAVFAQHGVGSAWARALVRNAACGGRDDPRVIEVHGGMPPSKADDYPRQRG